LLLALVDRFEGWVEALLCDRERAREVVHVLTTEIIPWFDLPRSFQRDHGPRFKVEVTQGLSRVLGINYQLLCAWCFLSSGKVEKDELLKRHPP
jgi:hypothetical protein